MLRLGGGGMLYWVLWHVHRNHGGGRWQSTGKRRGGGGGQKNGVDFGKNNFFVRGRGVGGGGEMLFFPFGKKEN